MMAGLQPWKRQYASNMVVWQSAHSKAGINPCATSPRVVGYVAQASALEKSIRLKHGCSEIGLQQARDKSLRYIAMGC